MTLYSTFRINVSLMLARARCEECCSQRWWAWESHNSDNGRVTGFATEPVYDFGVFVLGSHDLGLQLRVLGL